MLQTLNIPSSPLPEAASPPTGTPGDGGERAEFAQLLQQAQASDADVAPDAKPSPQDARTDTRVRQGASRTAPEHKPHDARRAFTDAEVLEPDAETRALPGCSIKPGTPSDTPALTLDTPVVEHTAANDDEPIQAIADAAPPLPLHSTVPLAASTVSPATLPPSADERSVAARSGARHGARDLRAPPRPDATSLASPDAAATRALPAVDATALTSKDAGFDLALRHASGGRAAVAPLPERAFESMPAGAQAFGVARELHQPFAARTEGPAEATLRAAPDEAGFAPALGAQVALWVKDGVQEARLQLHPAELGPVTVQIALEGQAAHVDFTAAVAATRESIEQSLPALAAALRESGFTLAGGGVFGGRPDANDGQRERTAQGRGTRATASAAAEGITDAAAAAPRRWARSLVDLYA
jgi:flagellar hook-length control protein FliK